MNKRKGYRFCSNETTSNCIHCNLFVFLNFYDRFPEEKIERGENFQTQYSSYGTKQHRMALFHYVYSWNFSIEQSRSDFKGTQFVITQSLNCFQLQNNNQKCFSSNKFSLRNLLKLISFINTDFKEFFNMFLIRDCVMQMKRILVYILDCSLKWILMESSEGEADSPIAKRKNIFHQNTAS